MYNIMKCFKTASNLNIREKFLMSSYASLQGKLNFSSYYGGYIFNGLSDISKTF